MLTNARRCNLLLVSSPIASSTTVAIPAILLCNAAIGSGFVQLIQHGPMSGRRHASDVVSSPSLHTCFKADYDIAFVGFLSHRGGPATLRAAAHRNCIQSSEGIHTLGPVCFLAASARRHSGSSSRRPLFRRSRCWDVGVVSFPEDILSGLFPFPAL